jgi:hypothetical protein
MTARVREWPLLKGNNLASDVRFGSKAVTMAPIKTVCHR